MISLERRNAVKKCGGIFGAARPALITAVLMLAIIGLSFGNVPNIVGNWTGLGEGYQNGTGYLNKNEAGALTMMISEQKGRLFTGKFIINDSSEHKVLSPMTEGFSGVIAHDNKTLYIAEYDKGYDIGTIISNDMVELAYLEDGKNAGTFILTLTRNTIKS
jgi:hypothetical protein